MAGNEKSQQNAAFRKLVGIWLAIFFIFAGYMLLPDTKAIRQNVNEKKIGNFLYTFHKAETLKDKQALPEVELLSREGRQVDLQSLTTGKVTIINFWATWCVPCLEELPSLARFQIKNPDILIVPVSLDFGKTSEDLASVFQKPDLQDLRWFYDNSGSLRKSLNLPVYPTSYVLDKHGSILYILQGPADWSSDEAQDFADSLRTNY